MQMSSLSTICDHLQSELCCGQYCLPVQFQGTRGYIGYALQDAEALQTQCRIICKGCEGCLRLPIPRILDTNIEHFVIAQNAKRYLV